MATAVTLKQAALQSWDNLQPFAIAGTMRARLLQFCTAVKAQFPQSLVVGHPIANWIGVLEGFATNMSPTGGNWTLLRQAAETLYRTCFMGYTIAVQGGAASQVIAMLAAYNAAF